MKHMLIVFALVATLSGCGHGTAEKANSTDSGGLTNPTAIDTTKHPSGVDNSSVISTDTAAMNSKTQLKKGILQRRKVNNNICFSKVTCPHISVALANFRANSNNKMKTDSHYLEQCSVLARQAAAKGNAGVGAIITCGDAIISQAEEAGKTKNDVTCHAEMEAIRFAIAALTTNNLSDCVLYSTHEPCIMCSYAIRFYKIKKVVFANAVTYFGGFYSSMPVLSTDAVPPHWSQPPAVLHLKKEE